jgi:hypothetical protein
MYVMYVCVYVEFVGFKKQEIKKQVAKHVWQDDRMDNTIHVQFKRGTEAVTLFTPSYL